MRHVTVLCVGKLRESYWREACAEYQKRLQGFCRLSVWEVEEERLPDAPSPAQITAALEAEGKRLLSKIPAGAAVLPLCVEGDALTSEELSGMLARLAVSGKSDLCFLIGSSFGLSGRVKAAATRRLSLSPLTFPHQLARVVLLEQLYRAFQIEAGGKYHK